MPLKDTRHLDLYISHSEWTTLALLICACLKFQSRHNEEYCYLMFKMRQHAPPDYFSNFLEISSYHDEENSSRKRKLANDEVLHSKTSVAAEETSATSSSTATLEVELEDILYRYGDLRDPYLLEKALMMSWKPIMH